VGIGICIREDHGRFVLARSEWITPITDVEVGEAIGLIHALRWAGEPQIRDMDFEGDCKRVVDNLYNNKNHASYFGAIIRDRRNLLNTSLMNSHVKFIRRQANEVVHRLAKTAPLLTSFHIHIDIPTYIFTIIMNKMR
jgi:ribonuclease HI